MEAINRSNLNEHIGKVVVTFLDTGKVQQLAERKNSANHFFEPFQVGQDEVRLRLDWTERDADFRPTLDADFYDIATGKKRTLKGRRKDAHHTEANPGAGRLYEWEFDGTSVRFTVAVTWLAYVSDILHASVTCDAVVIRAKDVNKEP